MNQRLPDIVSNYLSGIDNIVAHKNNLFGLPRSTGNFHKSALKQIILITGPSGAGKDTLINHLPAGKFVRWRTWTTRAEVRNDEKINDPYVRVTPQEFMREIEKGHFLEYNTYADNMYGTHKHEVAQAFEDGRIPVLRVDPRGAMKFNSFYENREDPFHDARLTHFFVIPPSRIELTRRLREREQDPEKMAKRLQAAVVDLPFVVNADYLLVSETNLLDEATEAIDFCLENLLT